MARYVKRRMILAGERPVRTWEAEIYSLMIGLTPEQVAAAQKNSAVSLPGKHDESHVQARQLRGRTGARAEPRRKDARRQHGGECQRRAKDNAEQVEAIAGPFLIKKKVLASSRVAAISPARRGESGISSV